MVLGNIVEYLNYLNRGCGLRVSVHFRSERMEALPREAFFALLPYNSHNNLYCLDVKSRCENKERCILNQHCIYDGKQDEEQFLHRCYAGVTELITPVCLEGERIGYIAVSGFREGAHPRGAVGSAELWENELQEDGVPTELCRAVIPPLVYMMERLFATNNGNNDKEYLQMLNFLHEYRGSVSLDDLCRRFHRSRSAISRAFNRLTGTTLSSYCNNLKLDDGASLLKTSSLSVTEIAYQVGFCDTSYFIKLFKERYGISPAKFRKENDDDKVKE